MFETTSNRFDNRYTQLPDYFYSYQTPQRYTGTRLVDVSPACCELLSLEPGAELDEALVNLMSGEVLWPGMRPLAQKYTGHQFGYYNPDLGDGRGLLLGEWVNARHEHYDLHMKGAGVTPFSRHGDGQAVFRSTLREYLASEAMAALGIASSRALAVGCHDHPVRRETIEPAASLIRVAPTHVRFGHFEWLSHAGLIDGLRQLCQFVIDHHFPEVKDASYPTLAMFEKIAFLTADMIADWQAVGFVHGVMNTDNMSVLGMTFDYGPYAFQEQFHPYFNPNHSDTQNRYGYDSQPSIGMWNLGCLASALLVLVTDEMGTEEKAREALGNVLERYGDRVNRRYGERMRAKLGLQSEREEDPRLIGDFLTLLTQKGRDYHRSFRILSDWTPEGLSHNLITELGDDQSMKDWLIQYENRLMKESISHSIRISNMNKCNPIYVLRSHLIQDAISSYENNGDTSEIKRLRSLIMSPYTSQANHEYYEQPDQSGRSISLSCSS